MVDMEIKWHAYLPFLFAENKQIRSLSGLCDETMNDDEQGRWIRMMNDDTNDDKHIKY